MARPERNTVDYYPHILGDGKKMFFIEHKYGNDGYATWHKILEKLSSTDYHYLNLNKEEEVMFLAAKCHIEEERLLAIIGDLARLDVFDKELWESKVIWSEMFVKSIEDAYNKRNNKCMTLQSLRILLSGLGVLKPLKGILKGDGNPQSKVKDSKVKESKEESEPVILNHSFKKFWDLYDKKRGDLAKIEAKWENLSDNDRDLIIAYIPKYIASEPEKRFRKDPDTFLNQKSWNDEIIIKGSLTPNQQAYAPTRTFKIDHSNRD